MRQWEVLQSSTALISSATHTLVEARKEDEEKKVEPGQFIKDTVQVLSTLEDQEEYVLLVAQLSSLCGDMLMELGRATDQDPLDLLQRMALKHAQLGEEM